MGKVTALMMDTITDKSGHTMTGMAVSVCLTPAAPSPLPIPYPLVGSVAEGIDDPCMRTKIESNKILTVGGCMSKCHGNEPGTLKEVVSFNTAGPCFPWLGAPIVLIELGMAGITGSMGQMNKQPIPGAGGSASGAGGAGGGGSGGGGGGGSGTGGSPQGPAGGGGGGGGSNAAAAPPQPPAPPTADGQAVAGHPIDVVTGALFTQAVDLTMPGPLWVRMVRQYTSSNVERDCGLGRGWWHGLAISARAAGDDLVLTDETGRETRLVTPAGDEPVLLPYGRTLRWSGEDLVLELGDDLERVLRRAGRAGRWQLAELRDAWGNAADVGWTDGEVTSVVDAVGRRAELVVEGRLKTWWIEVQAEGGDVSRHRAVTWEIDERGDLVSAIDAGGAETRYAYDDAHYLVEERTPDGVVWRFVHRPVRGVTRCVESWGELADGRDVLAAIGAPEPTGAARPRGILHVRLEYGPGPHETRVVDGAGAVHLYAGNALGLVERMVDPTGHVIVHRYDAAGRLISVLDGDGRTLRRGFDPAGRLAEVALGAEVVRIGHDDEAATTTVRGPGGVTVSSGRKNGKIARVDQAGLVTAAAFDDRGRNVGITWPDGSKDALAYDAHGNLAKVTRAEGGEHAYRFDALGRPVELRGPTGATFRLSYDSRGDLTLLEGPEGQRVEATLDDARHVVRLERSTGWVENTWVGPVLVEQVHEDGTRFRFGWDALLRLAWIENAAGERFSLAYDGRGLPIRQTTFSGLLSRFEHDGAGRLVSVLRADESRLREQHDEAGRLAAREPDGMGATRFTWDDAGRLASATSASSTVTFSYDEHGRLAREAVEAGAHRFSTTYRRDALGRVVERRHGDWAVTRTRGAAGTEVVEVRVAGKELARLQVRRDPTGAERARALLASTPADGDPAPPRAAIETTRSPLGLPLAQTITAAERTVRTRRFTWDPRGPVLASIEDDQRGSRRYELDRAGRPLAVEGLGARERFTYSPHGTPLPAEGGWSLGPNGRPTRTAREGLTYDRLGRLAERDGGTPATRWTYGYDENDRLIRAQRGDGLVVELVVDAFGRVLGEIAGGRSTWFGWDGMRLVEERSTDRPTVRRVFDLDDVTPVLELRGEDVRLIATDAVGTPWAYVDEAGVRDEIALGAWGEVVWSHGDPGTLRFAGQRWSELLGLADNVHRWYAPELHVFTTPDPLGLAASTRELGFVPNVTAWLDPLGLLTIITASNAQDLNQAYYGRYATQYPGARILRPHEVTPGSLAGETEVLIDTHGAPGQIEWGGQWIDGNDVGGRLNAAGFNGNAPGARVDVVACNSATRAGLFRNSVSQDVANTTGATTSGGQAFLNSAFLGNQGWSGLVSGMPSGNPPSGLGVNGLGSWRTGIRPQPRP